jgi:hypothetical protein
MDRRYFGAVNPSGQIRLIRASLDLRHCFTGAEAIGDDGFVDSEASFRTAREHRMRQRQS